MSELSVEQVTEEALKLPVTARAELARELLHSLEPAAETEIERLWLEEAERRDQEMDAGQSGLPIEQVLERARASLK